MKVQFFKGTDQSSVDVSRVQSSQRRPTGRFHSDGFVARGSRGVLRREGGLAQVKPTVTFLADGNEAPFGTNGNVSRNQESAYIIEPLDSKSLGSWMGSSHLLMDDVPHERIMRHSALRVPITKRQQRKKCIYYYVTILSQSAFYNDKLLSKLHILVVYLVLLPCPSNRYNLWMNSSIARMKRRIRINSSFTCHPARSSFIKFFSVLIRLISWISERARYFQALLAIVNCLLSLLVEFGPLCYANTPLFLEHCWRRLIQLPTSMNDKRSSGDIEYEVESKVWRPMLVIWSCLRFASNGTTMCLFLPFSIPHAAYRFAWCLEPSLVAKSTRAYLGALKQTAMLWWVSGCKL